MYRESILNYRSTLPDLAHPASSLHATHFLSHPVWNVILRFWRVIADRHGDPSTHPFVQFRHVFFQNSPDNLSLNSHVGKLLYDIVDFADLVRVDLIVLAFKLKLKRRGIVLFRAQHRAKLPRIKRVRKVLL